MWSLAQMTLGNTRALVTPLQNINLRSNNFKIQIVDIYARNVREHNKAIKLFAPK